MEQTCDCDLKNSIQDTALLGGVAKLRKATISFVISIGPHGATRISLHGLTLNLMLENILKIRQEN
jgi:predicted Ser/Thr protein kinase